MGVNSAARGSFVSDGWNGEIKGRSETWNVTRVANDSKSAGIELLQPDRGRKSVKVADATARGHHQLARSSEASCKARGDSTNGATESVESTDPARDFLRKVTMMLARRDEPMAAAMSTETRGVSTRNPFGTTVTLLRRRCGCEDEDGVKRKSADSDPATPT